MKNTYYSFELVTVLLFLSSLFSCKGQDVITQDMDTESTQIASNILEIYEDTAGNLWFGTSDQGAAKFDGKNLTYLTTVDGLCGNTVEDITEDKDGNLWFGTYEDMCYINAANRGGELFTKFEKTDSIPMLGYGWKNVKADKAGDIWVNSHHGMFQYKNGLFEEFEVPINLAKDKPSFCNTPGLISMDLIDRKGNRWFGTDGDGLYMCDQASFEMGKPVFKHFTIKDGLLSNNVNSIAEDGQGNIWLGCIIGNFDNRNEGMGGLCKLTTDGQITSFENIKGLFGNNIHTIYSDISGDIWIGATGYGLYHYTSTNSLTGTNPFTFYPEPNGIRTEPSGYISGVQSMLQDRQGRFWVGYAGGLYRLEADTFVNVTKEGPWF